MILQPTITRAVWAVVSASSALLLLSFFWHPFGPMAGALVLALALLAAFRPYDALLVFAALAPLSTILFVVLDVEAGGLRMLEALSLACLAGWAGRRMVSPHPMRILAAFRWSGTALVVAALASAVVSGAVILAEQGESAPASLVREWFQSYAVHVDAVTFALQFAQGLLLMLAVADVCAETPSRREGVVRMIVVGASAAALFNVLRLLIDGALPSEEPWQRFATLLATLRVNVHHGDLNAAGSYFALAWFLALVLTARHRPAAGAVLLISSGLWIAGSRAAMAATLLVAALSVIFARMRASTRTRAAIGVLLIAIGFAFVLWRFPLSRHVADPSVALRIRIGLASGAIAMAAEHPVFGAGLGHFYDLSDRYVHVPNYIVKENAHNNFLQILAELGAPGLWLFLAVIGTALSGLRSETNGMAWAVAAGICAFLLTCLAGHPLLVPLAAIPFWMTVGLAGSYPAQPPHPALRMIAIALTLFLVLTLPARTMAAVRNANMENTSAGLSAAWQRDEDGRRFRWSGGRATFYVPSAARTVTIPLRLGDAAASGVQVRMLLDGREANRIELRADGVWSMIRLIMPRRFEAAYSRLDLKVSLPGSSEPLEAEASNDGGVLMVGQPEIRY